MSKCNRCTTFFILPNILVISSGISIIIAISLAGYSLSRSVKWNLIDSSIDYGGPGMKFFFHAYQNLWTSYDITTYDANPKYLATYVDKILRKECWRVLPCFLVLASVASSLLSILLVTLSVVPVFQRNGTVIYIFLVEASFLALSGCGMLGYALMYYYQKYPSIHSNSYKNPSSSYPQEDNLSTGFYTAAVSAGFLTASAILNIISIFVRIKRHKVQPEKTRTKE